MLLCPRAGRNIFFTFQVKDGQGQFPRGVPMDAASLLRQAEKYRALANGINDRETLVVLENMACELELRARLIARQEARCLAYGANPRRRRR
jgi:hypothetical protein